MGERGKCSKLHAEAAGLGVETISRLIDGRRVSYRRVECGACGKINEIRHAYNAPPDQVRQKFETKGWTFGKSICCPECSRPERKEKAVSPQKDDEQEEVLKMKPPEPQSMGVREPLLDEVGRVSRLLDECFEAGRYLDGWSDRRVGEALDLPWAMVARIREALRGPLREDPEIVALRSGIATLETLFGDEVTILKARLAALEGR